MSVSQRCLRRGPILTDSNWIYDKDAIGPLYLLIAAVGNVSANQRCSKRGPILIDSHGMYEKDVIVPLYLLVAADGNVSANQRCPRCGPIHTGRGYILIPHRGLLPGQQTSPDGTWETWVAIDTHPHAPIWSAAGLNLFSFSRVVL